MATQRQEPESWAKLEKAGKAWEKRAWATVEAAQVGQIAEAQERLARAERERLEEAERDGGYG